MDEPLYRARRRLVAALPWLLAAMAVVDFLISEELLPPAAAPFGIPALVVLARVVSITKKVAALDLGVPEDDRVAHELLAEEHDDVSITAVDVEIDNRG